MPVLAAAVQQVYGVPYLEWEVLKEFLKKILFRKNGGERMKFPLATPGKQIWTQLHTFAFWDLLLYIAILILI
jgi:hypothetical protein